MHKDYGKQIEDLSLLGRKANISDKTTYRYR